MLSWDMLQRARRVAWSCRPRMSDAKARAYGRADRDVFGFSRDGGPASKGRTRRPVDSSAPHQSNETSRRVPPPPTKRMWWEDKEE